MSKRKDYILELTLENTSDIETKTVSLFDRNTIQEDNNIEVTQHSPIVNNLSGLIYTQRFINKEDAHYNTFEFNSLTTSVLNIQISGIIDTFSATVTPTIGINTISVDFNAVENEVVRVRVNTVPTSIIGLVGDNTGGGGSHSFELDINGVISQPGIYMQLKGTQRTVSVTAAQTEYDRFVRELNANPVAIHKLKIASPSLSQQAEGFRVITGTIWGGGASSIVSTSQTLNPKYASNISELKFDSAIISSNTKLEYNLLPNTLVTLVFTYSKINELKSKLLKEQTIKSDTFIKNMSVIEQKSDENIYNVTNSEKSSIVLRPKHFIITALLIWIIRRKFI